MLFLIPHTQFRSIKSYKIYKTSEKKGLRNL